MRQILSMCIVLACGIASAGCAARQSNLLVLNLGDSPIKISLSSQPGVVTTMVGHEALVFKAPPLFQGNALAIKSESDSASHSVTLDSIYIAKHRLSEGLVAVAFDPQSGPVELSLSITRWVVNGREVVPVVTRP